MGKRNRKKKYKLLQHQAELQTTTLRQSVQEAAAQVESPERKALMSKLNEATTAAYAAHAREYRQVQSDLIKVLIVNGALFLVTIAAYFVNKSNGFLDKIYSSLL